MGDEVDARFAEFLARLAEEDAAQESRQAELRVLFAAFRLREAHAQERPPAIKLRLLNGLLTSVDTYLGGR